MKRLFGSLLLGMVGICMPLLANAEEPLTIYTVNYPLQYFAQRIAGEHAQVTFPGPADEDPAFWMPDTETIQRYQQADLILLNGAGYARWTKRISLPRLRSVDTSAGFRDRLIREQGGIAHSHGPGADHSHAGIAFTTWLDFEQAAQQAEAIMKALVRKRPVHQAEFKRNYALLEKELMSLDAEIRSLMSNTAQPLVASHPVYQYLARRYGLNLKAVMWEPETVPDEIQWQALSALLQELPAKWMIWEGQPAPVSVQRLREMGVGSLVYDPCANVPGRGDFMDVMKKNINNIKVIF
jgi:zinc transport system substrate-binding protein